MGIYGVFFANCGEKILQVKELHVNEQGKEKYNFMQNTGREKNGETKIYGILYSYNVGMLMYANFKTESGPTLYFQAEDRKHHS